MENKTWTIRTGCEGKTIFVMSREMVDSLYRRSGNIVGKEIMTIPENMARIAKKIPQPILKIAVSLYQNHPELCAEIYYAVKSFRSVKSGYVGLQRKDGDGEWEEYQMDDPYGEPYYVCAVFKNSQHIPVPIISNWYPQENRLQKLAIQLAGMFNPDSYTRMIGECNALEEE